MALSIAIEGVRQLEPGVWRAVLNPDELRVLGNCGSKLGDISVLLVETPTFEAERERLSVDRRCSFPINVGQTGETIIVETRQVRESASIAPTRRYTLRDEEFLSKISVMPEPLPALGKELLLRVRGHYHEDGLERTSSGKFVEGPDNFWTVKPQPRDRSLAVTVRGRPDSFKPSGLRVNDDRPGYSRFKLMKADELEEAVRLILTAKRRDS